MVFNETAGNIVIKKQKKAAPRSTSYHFSRPYFSMHHSCHELSVFCHTT